MKGLALVDSGVIKYIELDEPVLLDEYGCILRPIIVSPCTSDVHTIFHGGSKKKDNLILGHESVCEVVEVGKKVKDFKTGDIAKYDKNHDLVFVTRKDFQIKKMGHRIELGEIESIANKCELVKQSCCVYIPDKQQLKLYCEVFNTDTNSKEISAYLKEHLSDYMWPNKVIILDELPLNANGKINRTLLKEM